MDVIKNRNLRRRVGWVAFRPPKGLKTNIVNIDVYAEVIHAYRADISKVYLSWAADTIKKVRQRVDAHENAWNEVNKLCVLLV